jgi:DNA-binding transcriptional LysR family regulator
MDLRHLEYFSVLAEEGDVKRAAARLGITQSGLLQQIKELECELGFRLFSRDKHGATLTRSGEDFLPGVRDLLQHTERVSRFAHGLSDLIPRTLIIVYTRSGGLGLSVRIVESFRAAHPDITITTLVGHAAGDVEDLAMRVADVVFFRPPLLDRTHVQSVVVAHEPVVVAIPEGHPLASRSAVSPEDLSGVPLVCVRPERGHGLWETALDDVYPPDRQPEIGSVEPDEPHMLAAVASGLGVALITAPESEPTVPGVVVKPLTNRPTVPLAIAWRVDNVNPALSTFLMFASQYEAE